MIELRPYQKAAVDTLWQYWRENPRGIPLIAAPTGSGKSLIISEICRRVINARPQYRIIVLAHRKELINQNARKIYELTDFSVGIYSAGLGQKNIRNITCANIQSIFKKKIEAHLVLMDECHLFSGRDTSMYGKFINNCLDLNPELKVVGLSATPFRLDQGSLVGNGSFFSDLVYDIDIRSLINDGYLCSIISKPSDSKVDLTGVARSGYDYNTLDLESRFTPLVKQHCEEMISGGQGRDHWLIFSSTVNHASDISACMNALGVPSTYISGEMVPMVRDQRLRDFTSGKLRCLVNCDILTTGFDYPAIDYMGICRATKSTALYVQMVGRGMRIAEGKINCLVRDFGGNISRHGPVDCVTVSRQSKGGSLQIGQAPSKICPICGTIVSIRSMTCLYCGSPFPISSMIEHKASEAPILSELEDLEVKDFAWVKHEKTGKPPMLRLKMKFGLYETINLFFCFEHGGYATTKARKLWQDVFDGDRFEQDHPEATSYPMPKTTAEALSLVPYLKSPSRVKAIKKGKYYEVISLDYSKPEPSASDVLFEEYGLNI